MPPAKPKILTVAEANAIILASKLQAQAMPIEVPVVEELRKKLPNKNKGRPPTEKQLENLKKGMEAMKAKREALKLKKEEALRKVAAGEPLSDDEPEPPKPPPPPPVLYVKPSRADKGIKKSTYVSRDDFNNLTTTLLETIKQSSAPAVEKIVEKEVPVEKIVDREVVREKIVSGSEMLDRLFFSK
jgi:hypothetical protein